MPVTPWAADSLAHVRDEPSIQPIYSVELLDRPRWSGGVPASLRKVPAWNVEVTLDGGRAPYATARFSAPIDYIAATATSGYIPLQRLHSYAGAPVQIKAGYQRGATADLWPLFSGYITSRRLRIDADGNRYLEFTADSVEAMYNFPSSRNGNVGNAWTSLKEACETIDAYATPWYREVRINEESGQMNTPTSAQLTAWRAWQYQVGDNVMDTLIAWATALGQWVRGDARTFNLASPGQPQLLVSAAPDPYRAATALTTAMFTELDRVEDVGDWANILNLQVSWTDPTSKDTKTKEAVYLGSGVTGGLGQVRAKDVSMRIYPPSGALPASYPVADQWLKRIGPRQEAQWTGSSRAMYWLQPRIDGINLTDNGLGDSAGAIDSITWRLDDGTQTMTWSADAIYKP